MWPQFPAFCHYSTVMDVELFVNDKGIQITSRIRSDWELWPKFGKSLGKLIPKPWQRKTSVKVQRDFGMCTFRWTHPGISTRFRSYFSFNGLVHFIRIQNHFMYIFIDDFILFQKLKKNDIWCYMTGIFMFTRHPFKVCIIHKFLGNVRFD